MFSPLLFCFTVMKTLCATEWTVPLFTVVNLDWSLWSNFHAQKEKMCLSLCVANEGNPCENFLKGISFRHLFFCSCKSYDVSGSKSKQILLMHHMSLSDKCERRKFWLCEPPFSIDVNAALHLAANDTMSIFHGIFLFKKCCVQMSLFRKECFSTENSPNGPYVCWISKSRWERFTYLWFLDILTSMIPQQYFVGLLLLY